MESEGSKNPVTTPTAPTAEQELPGDMKKDFDESKESSTTKQGDALSADAQGDSKAEKEEKFDAKTVQLLTQGILEAYEPPLTTINTHLRELTEKQDEVHNMIAVERRRLGDTQNDAMIDAMLADIATNKEKLASIQNSMMNLHKRVQALQVRAANVEKAAKTKASSPNKTLPTSAKSV